MGNEEAGGTKNPAAVTLGSLGGKRRKKNLTKARLHEIAMKGVEAKRTKKLSVN